MKTRIIYTKFWTDNYISNLNHREKLAFIYFITNEKVNICGIYELTDKYIKMDLSLSQGELDKIKQKFTKDRKFIFINGWIKIINFELYNNFTGMLNEKAKEKELALIPEKIKEYIRSIDKGINRVSENLDTLNNHKSIIINNKSEISNHKSIINNEGDYKGEEEPEEPPKDPLEEKTEKPNIKYAEFVSMSVEEYDKLVKKYGLENTKAFIEKLDNWKGAKGKRKEQGSDYRKILNWVVDAVLEKSQQKKVKVASGGVKYEPY